MCRKILFVFFLVFAAESLFSQSIADFVVHSNLVEGVEGLTITGYIGKEKSIVIPRLIKGVPVTVIGDQAFMMHGLTYVQIPEGVIVIGKQAFFGNRLNKVEMPASVRSIGDAAFENNRIAEQNNDPREFVVAPPPDVVGRITVIKKTGPSYWESPAERIGAAAARTASVKPGSPSSTKQTPPPAAQLESIVLAPAARPQPNALVSAVVEKNYVVALVPPASPRVVGERTVPAGRKDYVRDLDPYAAESKYYEFEEVQPPVDNGTFVIKNNGDGSATVLSYKGIQDYVSIPKKLNGLDVSIISHTAFQGQGLTKVYIPDSVTYIGDACFAGNSISQVSIPDSVRYIGFQSFAGNDIKKITIGSGVNVQSDTFRNKFSDYYNINGQKSGTYIFNGTEWTYTHFGDIRYVYQ